MVTSSDLETAKANGGSEDLNAGFLMGRSIQYVAELRSVLVLGGRRRDVNPMLVHDVSTRYSQACTALHRLT